MGSGFYNSTSGMDMEMKRQEIIARNLAGINYAGFKREFVSSTEFKQTLEANMKKDKAGNGTSKGNVTVDFSQGPLKQTDRPLDFAIEGSGFFEVKTKDGGKLYTRNGAFLLSKEGSLMTQEGYTLMGETGGPIKLEATENVSGIQVTADGMVQVRQGNQQNYKMKNLDRIKIVDTKEKEKLGRLSANYFYVPKTEDSALLKPVSLGQHDCKTSVFNGFLESSNVSPVEDMTAMIKSQRDFEMGQKLMKSLTDIYQQELQKLN